MDNKPKKFRPKTTKGLVTALNQGREIDQRTTVAKGIRDVKEAVRTDLSQAAVALLEDDVAVASVIQKMALEQVMKENPKILCKDGRPHYAMISWMKFSAIKKSALLALRKFQEQKSEKNDQKNLGDLILEVSQEAELL